MAEGRHLETSQNAVLIDIINNLFKTGNKAANINVKTVLIHTVNGVGSKTAKNHEKGNVNHNNIDIQAMYSVVNIAFLMIFMVFRFVAVNGMYKLQFVLERRYASAGISRCRVSVCLGVCDTPLLNQNG